MLLCNCIIQKRQDEHTGNIVRHRLSIHTMKILVENTHSIISERFHQHAVLQNCSACSITGRISHFIALLSA